MAKREGRSPNAPGAVAPPDIPRPAGRDQAGRFLVGNPYGAETQFVSENWNALRHSLRSDRWPPELEVLRGEVDEFLAGCLVDEADAGDVPRRRLALLQYRARLHRRIIQIDSMLELKGLTDRRGKLRTAWIQMLSTLIEKARGLDVTLGLERKQKKVETLAEYLERTYGKREQPQDAAVRADEARVQNDIDQATAGNQASRAGTSDGGH
jgi:hypothetical protein